MTKIIDLKQNIRLMLLESNRFEKGEIPTLDKLREYEEYINCDLTKYQLVPGGKFDEFLLKVESPYRMEMRDINHQMDIVVMDWVAATKEVGGGCFNKDKSSQEGIIGNVNVMFESRYNPLKANLKLLAKMAIIWLRRKMKILEVEKEQEIEKEKERIANLEAEIRRQKAYAKGKKYRSNKSNYSEAYKDYFEQIRKSPEYKRLGSI